MAGAGYVVELLFEAFGWVPGRGGMTVMSEGVKWNYTSWLNIVFLLLARVLVVRFLRSGGGAMMRMMGGGPDDMAGTDHAGMGHAFRDGPFDDGPFRERRGHRSRGLGQNTAMVDSANSYLLVGGYGAGVHCLRYDADGALSPVASVDIADPSYVAYDGARGVLTAVVEQEPAGRVASARFTVAEGGSDVRDQTSSGGAAPCHLALHPDGSTLFVANYVSGTVAVFPVDAEGRVTGDEPAQLIQHTGSGPRADRQEGPHAHQVVVSPSGRWVLAVDLGTDSVYVYAYEAGRLAEHGVVRCPAARGPAIWRSTAPGAISTC